MTARIWLRLRWLAVRKRTLPWCMHAGCWERSVVTTRNGVPRRGNVCPEHFWRNLMTLLSDDEDEEPAP